MMIFSDGSAADLLPSVLHTVFCHLLPSRLYCRFRNSTGSAYGKGKQWMLSIARGLVRVGLYRRSGISPCPEDVFTLALQCDFFKRLLQEIRYFSQKPFLAWLTPYKESRTTLKTGWIFDFHLKRAGQQAPAAGDESNLLHGFYMDLCSDRYGIRIQSGKILII